MYFNTKTNCRIFISQINVNGSVLQNENKEDLEGIGRKREEQLDSEGLRINKRIIFN